MPEVAVCDVYYLILSLIQLQELHGLDVLVTNLKSLETFLAYFEKFVSLLKLQKATDEVKLIILLENFLNLVFFPIDRNYEGKLKIFADFNVALIDFNLMSLILSVVTYTIEKQISLFSDFRLQFNAVKLAQVDLERVVFHRHLDRLLLQIELRCSSHDCFQVAENFGFWNKNDLFFHIRLRQLIDRFW